MMPRDIPTPRPILAPELSPLLPDGVGMDVDVEEAEDVDNVWEAWVAVGPDAVPAAVALDELDELDDVVTASLKMNPFICPPGKL